MYSIWRQSVVDVAGQIRDSLEQLARWALLRNEAERHRLFCNLAEQGERLKFLLFDCPDKKSDVALLQEWIEARRSEGDDKLTITTDPLLHIPWGFVFEGDPATFKSSTASIEDCRPFWCLSRRLSLGFSAAHRMAKPTRRRESYQLLSILNRHVFSDLEANRPEQYTELSRVLDRPVGRAFNLEACNALIAAAARGDTLVHFFGHCTKGSLDLGDEMIDTIRFKMMLEKLLDRSPGEAKPYHLIFLNACETLGGNMDSSFRSAASRPGLCGMIATEAAVPQTFAAEYGIRFLRAMLDQGTTIGDTMEALRRDPGLWPLSLLYTCYAASEYRIAA